MNRVLELVVFYGRLFLMLIWLMIASLIALPLALLRWKNYENNFAFGVYYGAVARAIMGIRVQVDGKEHLKNRPAIYAVNHQSGLDMATLSAAFPKGAVIIAKRELRYIPIFGLMFEAFGNILINRSDRSGALSGLNAAIARVRKENFSIWVFPEGTRNASGVGLLPFKKGAFYMAIQAQVPIVPVVCSKLQSLVSFPKKYARSGKLFIKVLPPISTLGMNAGDADRLLTETREQMLKAVEEVSARALQENAVR